MEYESHSSTLKSVYSLGKTEGDISIKIIPPSEDDDRILDREPLRKRRKLNNNQESLESEESEESENENENVTNDMRASRYNS